MKKLENARCTSELENMDSFGEIIDKTANDLEGTRKIAYEFLRKKRLYNKADALWNCDAVQIVDDLIAYINNVVLNPSITTKTARDFFDHKKFIDYYMEKGEIVRFKGKFIINATNF